MIFVTGTDTNIGKTLICSWLCLHTGFNYFKPIQTGLSEGRDSDTVAHLAQVHVYPEAYQFDDPVSPHLAAQRENKTIDLASIRLPQQRELIVEGAGGVLVPINQNKLMIDLIAHLKLPTLLVASTRLGTLNHTLLTLSALRERELPILGIVMTGGENRETREAIEYYGQTEVLDTLPWVEAITPSALRAIQPSSLLMSKL